ncbi:MAG: F0F1 ATP synthase subunit B [Oscillospiraceae bacterium]|nr:F0F1 ATP synthase subunit B [Oscillospiraceae bacterium]
MEGFLESFESFIGVNFWTALFTLLNFIALFLVMKHFLIGPVLKIIHDRQKEIDDLYADAGAAKDNALALESEYKEKLSVATETGERIVKEAVVRGQSREEEIIRQANAEAAAIMDKAAADIAMEKKKAINDAKDEISDMAVAIAEKVVGRELNAADQADLVDSFIDRLGDDV